MKSDPRDTPTGRPLEGRTVLVVEDHIDSADATRLMLEWLGARVSVAKHGQEAIALLAAAPADVVLSDLRLPGMTGWELARIVRGDPQLVGIRIIALTGFIEDRGRLARGGFDGYLLKPVDEAALLSAVLGTRAVPGTERKPPSTCPACGSPFASGGTLLFQGEQFVHAICWRDRGSVVGPRE